MKNDQVMATQRLAKVAARLILAQLMAIIDTKLIFGLPIITMKIDGQTQFKATRTKIGHFSSRWLKVALVRLKPL